MKVYNLGSLNIDYVYAVEHFVRPGETLSSNSMNKFPGGKGLNQSVALSKAGAAVVHGGIIGEDGKFLLDVLEKAGADASKRKTADCPSGHAIIQVDPSGQNSIVLFAGANHRFDEEYINEVLFDAEKGDIVLLQNEINGLERIFKIAHEKGLKIAFNPSPLNEKIKELPLELVDLWFCNEIEGGEITGESEPEKILDAFAKKYPNSNVVLTLGTDGSMLLYEGKRYFQPIIPCKAVDTTAAGDTFTGFFIASLISGKDMPTSMKTAATASSITVSRHGASISIPTIDEVIGTK